jgi:hypothetical protein
LRSGGSRLCPAGPCDWERRGDPKFGRSVRNSRAFPGVPNVLARNSADSGDAAKWHDESLSGDKPSCRSECPGKQVKAAPRASLELAVGSPRLLDWRYVRGDYLRSRRDGRTRLCSRLANHRRACRESRIVLTFDLDLGDILEIARSEAPSVVIFRLRNQTPTAVNPRLFRVIHDRAAELARGALVIIEDEGSECVAYQSAPDDRHRERSIPPKLSQVDFSLLIHPFISVSDYTAKWSS